MTFHVLEVKRPSANALRKMRNGEPVRISAGTGLPIVVNSGRLNDIAKKFAKGAAHTVALTKDELDKNLEHIQGGGIFGKKFDKTLEKHGVKHLAYHLGDIAKPVVKGGIDTLAGMASIAQPELAPLAMGAAYLANDYLDHPNSYQADTIKQQAKDQAMNHLNDQMNQQFGTNYGNNLQATMNNLSQSNLAAQLQNQNNLAAATSYITPILTQGVSAPETLNQVMTVPTVLPQRDTITKPVRGVAHGMGLFVNQGARGDGLFSSMSASGDGLAHDLIRRGARTAVGQGLHSRRAGKLVERGSIGAGGSLLYNQQATSSQPYMEFYGQSNFVQPSVRKFRQTVSNWSAN